MVGNLKTVGDGGGGGKRKKRKGGSHVPERSGRVMRVRRVDLSACLRVSENWFKDKFRLGFFNV
ncbi:hypothetical protein TIFTF001_032242 [Ficus carica]|uniref:Uncharacterized protein n=1 Tax=Ficus carica TaxID=3494 RepID=A0AA88DWA8_FICCA|nr:hypothetical protein TIFTF001_032242 [Ficus carica]